MGNLLNVGRGLVEHKVDWKNKYLTFEALESGTFQFTNIVNYSLNDGATWTELPANTDTPTLAAGDKISWKATLTPNSTDGIGTFSSSGSYNAMGNPLSLNLGDSFVGVTTMPNVTYIFYKLFYENTGLICAHNLKLCCLRISDYCYKSMFSGCTGLTTAPDLPAVLRTGGGNINILSIGCYYAMFYNCSSLIKAPVIDAEKTYGYTTAAVSSLAYMFYGCNSLVSIEKIPANSASCSHGYYYMFYNCSSLTTIPTMTIVASKGNDAAYMFYGCTSLVSAANITITGGSSYQACRDMFSGCTSLTTAPTMNITACGTQSFYEMFLGCTALTDISHISLMTTSIGSACYQAMFYHCTSLVTAPAISATTRSSGGQNEMYQMFYECTSLKTPPPTLSLTSTSQYTYGYMFLGCTNLESVPVISTTQFGDYCCRSMFKNCTKITSTGTISITSCGRNAFDSAFSYCTSLITQDIRISLTTTPIAVFTLMFDGCIALTSAPALPSTTLSSTCYAYMFRGCKALITAPELPATTLVSSCYLQMFDGCNNLNYIKCLATDKSATYCLSNWVRSVSSTGTFVKDANTTWSSGNSGIPNNWTIQDYVEN